MGVLVKINGSSIADDLHEPSGVEVELSLTERSIARFTTQPGYMPAVGNEVTIYDDDETTAIFGGIVFQRQTRGFAQHVFGDVECVDWTYYIDHLTIDAGTLTGTVNLKTVLQWFQTNYFAAYGFTLDAAQVNGPTLAVDGYSWERMGAADALRIVGKAAEGYVFQIDPDKEWRMILPSMATPTAPFSITNTNGNARVLEWSQSRENYATKVILKWGENGESETIADAAVSPAIEIVVTDTTITDSATAANVADGYLTAAFQTPRTFDIDSVVDGLRPGQVINIDAPTMRAVTNENALITKVVITMRDATWSYRATATTGIYQGSGLDFWRRLDGGAGGGATSMFFTGGTGTIAGQALTKTDDSNVTVTLGGNHATALVNAASLTLGWTGQLSVARGGTGASTFTANRLLYGNGTSAIATSTSLTFDGAHLSTSGIKLANLTSGRIPYATTNGELIDNAGLRFSGTAFTVDTTANFAGGAPAVGENQAWIGYNTGTSRAIFGVNGTGGSDRGLEFWTLVGGVNYASALTIAANGTLTVGGNAVFTANANPSVNYVSNLGNLTTKYLSVHAAELWVSTLVAQETIATIGGRIVVAPSTRLAADLPAAQAYLKVAHNQMDLNDIIYLESSGKVEWIGVLSWAITGVSTVNENFVVAGNQTAFFPASAQFTVRGSTGNNATWTVSTSTHNAGPDTTTINVTGNVTNATADGYIAFSILPADGQYTYLVNRNLDGTGANQWYAGDGVVNTGTTGDGFIDLFSTNGLASGVGPTIIGNVRTGTTYSNVAPRWAIGNLNNIYNYSAADVYGVAFGDPSATYVTIDATNGIRFRNSSSTKFSVDTSGNLTLSGNLTVGLSGNLMSGATAFGTGTGYWLSYNGGAPQFRVGTVSGNRMEFNGADDSVVVRSENVVIDEDGISITPTGTAGYVSDTAYKFTGTGDHGLHGEDTDTGWNVRLKSSHTGSLAQKVILEAIGDSDGTPRTARITVSGLPLGSTSEVTYDATNHKFTGGMWFGSHSAVGSESITGYITIKDSGGTDRKLAVIS